MVFGSWMSASQVLVPNDVHDGMVSIGTLMLHFLSDDLKAIRYSSALVMDRHASGGSV